MATIRWGEGQEGPITAIFANIQAIREAFEQAGIELSSTNGGGAVARFAIPADATEIRLHSRSFVPERVRVGAGDGRRLGVPVRGLSVVDGAGVTRLLPIASEALSRGFSFVQGGADRPWRWTTSEAVGPPILWAGTEGGFSLIVELAPEEGALQAWQAHAMATSQDASEVSLEAAAA